MSTAAEAVNDAVIQHAIAMYKVTGTARGLAHDGFDELRRSLVAVLASRSPLTAATAKQRAKAGILFAKEAAGLIADFYQTLATDLGDLLDDYAAQAGVGLTRRLNVALGVGLFSAQDTAAFVRSADLQTLFGSAIHQHLLLQAQQLATATASCVSRAINANLSNDQLIASIAGTLQPARGRGSRTIASYFVGGAFDAASTRLTLLVKAIMSNAVCVVSRALCQSHARLLQGVQMMNILDSSSSSICKLMTGAAWRLDGSSLMLDGAPFIGFPPFHYGCKTQVSPVLVDYEHLLRRFDSSTTVGRRLRSMPPGASDFFDGSIAPVPSFKAWLGAKPIDFQQKLVGRRRWSLWQEGKLTFTQLMNRLPS